MESIKRWYRECTAKNIIKTLLEKDYDAVYADNIEEAKKIALDMIPEGSTIAVGGSITLSEVGIMEEIQSDKYKFIDRFNTKSFDDMLDKYREGFSADVFVTSTNALTKNGELVNLDCTGNRVGAMGFGPKKVIVILGTNKIVDTIEEGMKRSKDVAPQNAKRICHKVPCNADGVCHDCKLDSRICNITSIIHNSHKFAKRIAIIVVPENLGY